MKINVAGYHCQRTDAPLEMLLAPVPINLPITANESVAALAVGRAHSLVLIEKKAGDGGRVLSFGNNSYGQCGRPVIQDEEYSGSKVVHTIPELEGNPVRSITCGQDHSLFITNNGHVFSCGWGDDGQTGQGVPGKQDKPSRLKGDIERENIIKVSSSGDCNLAINGELQTSIFIFDRISCPIARIKINSITVILN